MSADQIGFALIVLGLFLLVARPNRLWTTLGAMGARTLTLYSAHLLALATTLHYEDRALWFAVHVAVAAGFAVLLWAMGLRRRTAVHAGTALANFSAHDDVQAMVQCALQVGIVVFCPVGHVLQAQLTCLQKVPVHRGHIVAALNQFYLHKTGIGQGDRVVRLVGFASVLVILDADFGVVVPGAYSQLATPVVHGGFDIPHHIAKLADFTK